MIRSVISATGSYIPEVRIKNETFHKAEFYEQDGTRSDKDIKIVVGKFEEVTGIAERRYAKTDQRASDLGFLSAENALKSSGIEREALDYIIVAHNFGDVIHGNNRVNIVPSLASRIKALLKIQNPDCVAYDLPFGCPGWIQGLIQADYFIRSGDAKLCLVIGTETLSRIIDPHDRDSMIYSDGSGAVILEASAHPEKGIISHKTQTFANNYSTLLRMDKSYAKDNSCNQDIFLKMSGRKVYEFALSNVPFVIKAALDKAALSIETVDKILIHQANDKMDAAILARLFKLYGKNEIPEGIMPMTIGWLGNSSVASVPTLLDVIMKKDLPGHKIQNGDTVVMASVGAGMNINAVVYKF